VAEAGRATGTVWPPPDGVVVTLRWTTGCAIARCTTGTAEDGPADGDRTGGPDTEPAEDEDSAVGKARPPSSGAVADRWTRIAGTTVLPATGSALTGVCDVLAPADAAVPGAGRTGSLDAVPAVGEVDLWTGAPCAGDAGVAEAPPEPSGPRRAAGASPELVGEPEDGTTGSDTTGSGTTGSGKAGSRAGPGPFAAEPALPDPGSDPDPDMTR
jgi:hypothetical protein